MTKKTPMSNTDAEPVKCRRCGKPITGYAYYGPKGAECEECWHIVDTYIPTGKPCIQKRSIKERYKKIAESKEFKEAYEGKSIGEVMKIED